MIKCNVTVCGTIGRNASARTNKEGNSFLSFPLRVTIPDRDGQNEVIEISVSKDGPKRRHQVIGTVRTWRLQERCF